VSTLPAQQYSVVSGAAYTGARVLLQATALRSAAGHHHH